ncbi:cytochrome c [Tateyamaria omphalii]|uniref:c-type cytochrome n=1 Tax=Tateyamaria omphalii TaxID=299262 RepID=UPI001C991271|nr:cytochrome c [Tateyamaria omphalii]MBY5932093.1 cytochrome c [Tateyamaria omphalii]
MKNTISVAILIAEGFVGYALWPKTDQTTASAPDGAVLADSALVDIVIPDTLSANAQIGKRGFEANCVACHGTNAVGQDGVAPPLVHIIYEPGHHADESFQRAVAMGVRGHHWPFGNMPPIEGLTRGDVTMITAYIRELQQANGIN